MTALPASEAQAGRWRWKQALAGSVGVTLRSPGTPAVGLGELLVMPSGLSELFARRRDRLQTQLILAALLWAAGSLLSDLVNATSTFDLLRGQARVWLLLLTLLGVRRLQRSAGLTIPLLVSAFAVSALLGAVLFPAPSYSTDPWKFGLSLPTCLLALWLVRNAALAPRLAVVSGLSILNFGLGYRSLGGILLVVAVIQLFRAVPWRHRQGRITPLLIALVIMLYGLTVAYEQAVQAGVFGDQTAKFETQLDGEIGLLSGRIGTIAALSPISERPVIGWGTWANDPDLVQIYIDSVVDNHGRAFAPVNSPARFPAHSYLLQGWLENGLAALPFWLLTARLAISALRRTLGEFTPTSNWLLLDVLAMKFFWDFAFSPFGAETRALVAVSLAVFLTAIDQRQSQPVSSGGGTPAAPNARRVDADSTATSETADGRLHESIRRRSA